MAKRTSIDAERKNMRAIAIAKLGKALENDVATFQQALLDIACNDPYVQVDVAEQTGIRRETLWRYKTGTRASLATLLKIMAVVGAKLAVVPNSP